MGECKIEFVIIHFGHMERFFREFYSLGIVSLDEANDGEGDGWITAHDELGG
jgi:hypothetical protein